MSNKYKTNKTRIDKLKTKISKILSGIPHDVINSCGGIKDVGDNNLGDVPTQELLIEDLRKNLEVARKAKDKHTQCEIQRQNASQEKEAQEETERQLNSHKAV